VRHFQINHIIAIIFKAKPSFGEAETGVGGVGDVALGGNQARDMAGRVASKTKQKPERNSQKNDAGGIGILLIDCTNTKEYAAHVAEIQQNRVVGSHPGGFPRANQHKAFNTRQTEFPEPKAKARASKYIIRCWGMLLLNKPRLVNAEKLLR
jgi:hypothetical protein